ncbi:MAG: hypothetical protein N4J56_005777 [Chroococcidiopsis sp. SAG 2025]|nr:hypothetical protein [Chroococcidiopsis sp. SAG 2025]
MDAGLRLDNKMSISRRSFFVLAGASTAGTILAAPLKELYARQARGESIKGIGYSSLQSDPNGLLDLPFGFQYRVFSRTGDIMSDGKPVPGDHDGMAAFPGAQGTTILVRNHELSPDEVTKPKVDAPAEKQYDSLCRGGTTTLIVGRNRELIKDFASLAGTYRNCAGGPTPWGSWISCEENTSTPADNQPGAVTNVSKLHGYNFEVPSSATEPVNPIPLVAMGRFNHEAVAVDPKSGIVYQTEDRGDGLFYRFIPNFAGNLQAGGVLEALKIKDMPQAITKTNFPVGQPMAVEWVRIDDVNPVKDTVRVEGFAKGAAQFSRGEGIWYGNGELYFCSTDGGELELGQVWRYVPNNSRHGSTLELFVEPNEQNTLDGPDNVVVSPLGDLFICEDGEGEQFVVGITPQGELYDFARNALNESEFAGACFSPDGRTMFVNIQDPGITFAIWGPWRKFGK